MVSTAAEMKAASVAVSVSQVSGAMRSRGRLRRRLRLCGCGRCDGRRKRCCHGGACRARALEEIAARNSESCCRLVLKTWRSPQILARRFWCAMDAPRRDAGARVFMRIEIRPIRNRQYRPERRSSLRQRYAAAMPRNSSALRLAPPTSAPSTLATRHQLRCVRRLHRAAVEDADRLRRSRRSARRAGRG